MKKMLVTITCDKCEKDISPEVTCFPRKDILRVTCENVALHGNVMHAVAICPILENDLHFCGWKCLKDYIM